jgi:hypothetical protein
MKKVSIKNLSLLGLVLMGASALTAAILPKENAKKLYVEGDFLQVSASANNTPQFTCRTGNNLFNCDFSATVDAASATTNANGTSADADSANYNNTGSHLNSLGDYTTA